VSNEKKADDYGQRCINVFSVVRS